MACRLCTRWPIGGRGEGGEKRKEREEGMGGGEGRRGGEEGRGKGEERRGKEKGFPGFLNCLCGFVLE